MSELTSREIIEAIQRAMEETWRRIDQAKRDQTSRSRETERPNGSTQGAEPLPAARET